MEKLGRCGGRPQSSGAARSTNSADSNSTNPTNPTKTERRTGNGKMGDHYPR